MRTIVRHRDGTDYVHEDCAPRVFTWAGDLVMARAGDRTLLDMGTSEATYKIADVLRVTTIFDEERGR